VLHCVVDPKMPLAEAPGNRPHAFVIFPDCFGVGLSQAVTELCAQIVGASRFGTDRNAMTVADDFTRSFSVMGGDPIFIFVCFQFLLRGARL